MSPMRRSTRWRRHAGVRGVSLDRRIHGTLERHGRDHRRDVPVQDTLGVDGTGIGIAIVDSGVAPWHDDLGSSRVVKFVDFVGFQSAPYDDYGHGTHVAGILAGNGYDSGGRPARHRAGHDAARREGRSTRRARATSATSSRLSTTRSPTRRAFNLRVINLSVAASVYEFVQRGSADAGGPARGRSGAGRRVRRGKSRSRRQRLAAVRRDQRAGQRALGDHGRSLESQRHRAIASDDIVASFSSRGPSAIDFQAKPDLVAPGVGIESLAEAGSTLYNAKPLMRLWGTVPTATEPYFSLSGTSMASPVVSGTIALMLQANPALRPNDVKAILQFTAENRDGYDGLTEGAGFLNARGAVELAQSLAAGGTLDASTPHADPTSWSGHVIWGNHRLGGRALAAVASLWQSGRAVGRRWRTGCLFGRGRRQHRLGDGVRRRGLRAVSGTRDRLVAARGWHLPPGAPMTPQRGRSLEPTGPVRKPLQVIRVHGAGAAMKSLPLRPLASTSAPVIGIGAVLLTAFFPHAFRRRASWLFSHGCCC